MIAGWDEKSEFTETVDDRVREAGPDQPVQLLCGCVGHELLTPEKNNRNGEQGSREKQGVKTERRVQETREALRKGHLANGISPKTEFELEGSVDGTNGPTGTLLQVTAEIIGNGTKL